MYLNSQSIVNKIEELCTTTCDLKPDIICICESWCHPDINNSFLSIPGYKVIEELRKDRSDTERGIGGGLLVYVRDGLTVFTSSDNNIDFIQYCKFQVKLKSEILNACLIYRSPNFSPANNDELNNLITSLPKNCIIFGDFNYPNIDWNSYTSSSSTCKTFLDIVITKDYNQIIDFPTHLKGNILDLVLTDLPRDIISARCEGRLGKSDHSIIMIETNVTLNHSETSQKVPQWHKANFNQINSDLESFNWDLELRDLSAEEAWTLFTVKVNESVKKNVPFRIRRKASKPVWMNNKCLQAVRKKRRLWRTYKQSKAQQDFSAYKKQEKLVQKLCKTAKKSFEKKLASDKGNTRKFYAYVNSKKNVKSSVGPLIHEGVKTDDPKEMANILNKYFASVFVEEDTENLPTINEADVEPLEDIYFDEGKIKKKIEKLKDGSAPGPDGISVIFLKKTVNITSKILKIIFEKSFQTSSVPKDWKSANITAIFKNKGKKSDPSKYRQVSLTSIPGKLFESFVKDSIVNHLETNNLLNSSQHGFRPGRSCTTNLLEFLETVTKKIDEGKPMDLLYLDFTQAFDKVPRKRLIMKLKAHGIKGKALQWIIDWLSCRKQRVVLNGEVSDWEDSKSGVAQGSLLGPVCFTVYNNDIDEAVVIIDIAKKFADDSKGAHAICGPNDQLVLQQSIDNLDEWCLKWGMSFNTSKCKIIHVGRNNPNYDYSMNGETLQTSDTEKDIGFNIHSSLKPSIHCNIIAKKAHTVLSLVSRNFHYRDKKTFVNLYCQHVRPILEYASPVWSPWLECDKKVVEDVQKRMVKMISGLNGQTYEEKLTEIGLQTLEYRREKADMVQVFKMLKGIDNVDYKNWFEIYGDTSSNIRPNTRLSNEPLNIIQKRCNGDIRKYFFSMRVVPTWNSLPTDVKNSGTVAVFKSNYDRLHQLD